MSKGIKCLFIGLAVCTMLAAGCGTNSTATSQPAAASKTQVQNSEFNSYQNSRFGLVIQYPSSWKAASPAADLAGATFFAPSGLSNYDNGSSDPSVHQTDIVLTVGGNANVAYGPSVGQNFNQMVSAYENSYISELKKQKSVSGLTYGVVPNQWIWVSYYQNVGTNAIQYKKSYLSLNTIQEFVFTFPSTQADKYKPILTELQKSFVPGNKNG